MGSGTCWRVPSNKYSCVKPRPVILFGSYVRGDYMDKSGISILVVSDELPRVARQTFEALFDPENPRIVPLGMNTEVFRRSSQRENHSYWRCSKITIPIPGIHI